jgi:drug/metabolite transporter (DMT)-like permease
MWKNALFWTAYTLIGTVFVLAMQLDFLIPFRKLIYYRYLPEIGVFAGLLAINSYALYFILARKILLKDTGSKIVHLERQIRDGSLPHELGDHLSSDQ